LEDLGSLSLEKLKISPEDMYLQPPSIYLDSFVQEELG
jgi:hypothetical protein